MPLLLLIFLISGAVLASEAAAPENPAGADKVNVLPVPVVFFTPETGTGAGGGVYITYGGDAPANRNLLIPFFVYTEKNQSVSRLYWELWPVQDLYRIYSVLGYTNYPDKFFGTGNDTRPADAETFTEIYGAAELDAERKWAGTVYSGILLRSENFAIREKERGGMLDSGNIPGSSGGNLKGIGLQLRLLSLNHPFTPTEGYNISIRHISYTRAAGGSFRYASREARLRYYVPTGLHSVAAEYLVQQAEGDVPFRKLPMLGGQNLLRGYFLGRFRDKALQAAQIEYRHVVTKKTGVNLFIASGAVGEDLPATVRTRWHHAGGAGLRYIIVEEDNLGLRLDVAVNQEETSIYFGAGEAF